MKTNREYVKEKMIARRSINVVKETEEDSKVICDVPWATRSEWLEVYRQLNSTRWQDWREAYSSMEAWITAGNVPLAVRATMPVLKAMEVIHRSRGVHEQTGQILSAREQEYLIVNEATIKFVSAMSKAVTSTKDRDAQQTTTLKQSGNVAQPPTIVQNRNDIVHDTFKGMHCQRGKREAVSMMLCKVKSFYWDPAYEAMQTHQFVETQVMAAHIPTISSQSEKAFINIANIFTARQTSLSKMNRDLNKEQSNKLIKLVCEQIKLSYAEMCSQSPIHTPESLQTLHVNTIVTEILFKVILRKESKCFCGCRLKLHPATMFCLTWLLLHQVIDRTHEPPNDGTTLDGSLDIDNNVIGLAHDASDDNAQDGTVNHGKEHSVDHEKEHFGDNGKERSVDHEKDESLNHEIVNDVLLLDIEEDSAYQQHSVCSQASESNKRVNEDKLKLSGVKSMNFTLSTTLLHCLLDKLEADDTESDVASELLRLVLSYCSPSKSVLPASLTCRDHRLRWNRQYFSCSIPKTLKRALATPQISIDWSSVVPRMANSTHLWLNSYACKIISIIDVDLSSNSTINREECSSLTGQPMDTTAKRIPGSYLPFLGLLESQASDRNQLHHMLKPHNHVTQSEKRKLDDPDEH